MLTFEGQQVQGSEAIVEKLMVWYFATDYLIKQFQTTL